MEWFTTTEKMYAAYLRFCAQTGKSALGSSAAFSRTLKLLLVEQIQPSKRRVGGIPLNGFIGIRLKEGADVLYHKFYAVTGRNGVAVMDSWERVMRVRKYIKHATAKGFSTFREAEDWALGVWIDRFPQVDAPLSLQTNQAIFVSRERAKSGYASGL